MRISLLLAVLCLPVTLLAQQKDSAVILTTPTGKISGTLTLPARLDQPVPMVLIIAGSGPTDRDGNQVITSLSGVRKLTNNSLLALGDSLAKAGIASLRYDKRGIAASKEAALDEQQIRFDFYVNDAIDWVKKLQSDKRFSAVYILGHSEGSLIGMLAAQRTPVAGFVSLAGPALPADSTIIKQLQASPAVSGTMVDSVRMLFGMLRRGEEIVNVPSGFYQALLRKSVQPYLASWIKYNPEAEIAKLRIPTLIIQGTTDIQIDTSDAYVLAKAKPDAELQIIQNMNHVLKDLPSKEIADNQFSYMDPGFLLKRELTPVIASFILANEKKKKKPAR